MIALLLTLLLGLLAPQIAAVTPNKHKFPPDPRLWILTVSLAGCTSQVNRVDHRVDGKMIATGHEDGIVRIWDAMNGEQLHRLRGHERQVLGVAFSPDGKQVATGGFDKTARLWNLATGKEILKLVHESFVWSVAFHPEGTQIATVSKFTTRLWDVKTGKEIRSREHGVDLRKYDVAFSPDGQKIATASQGRIHLWHMGSGKDVLTFDATFRRSFDEEGESIYKIAFSRDGTLLISADSGGNVDLWDVATGKHLRDLEWGSFSRSFMGGGISPDGKRVVSLSGNSAHVWEASTGKELWSFCTSQGRIQGVGFRADGKLFAVKTNPDKSTSIWYLARD